MHGDFSSGFYSNLDDEDDEGENRKNEIVAKELRTIKTALEKIEKSSKRQLLTPEIKRQMRMREYYDLDTVGPAIGINIDGSAASEVVRQHGIDAFHKLVEDRILNFKINTTLAGSLLLAAKNEKPEASVNLVHIEGQKDDEAALSKVQKIDDLKIAFEMVDLVRKYPTKTVTELLDQLEADSKNKFISRKKNLFPNENGLTANRNRNLKAILLYAIKRDLASGGLDFQEITLDNVDKHPEVIRANAEHLHKTVLSTIANADKIAKTINELIPTCTALTAKLDQVKAPRKVTFTVSRTTYRDIKARAEKNVKEVSLPKSFESFDDTIEPTLIESEMNRDINSFLKAYEDSRVAVDRFSRSNAFTNCEAGGSKCELDHNFPSSSVNYSLVESANRNYKKIESFRTKFKAACQNLKSIASSMGDQDAIAALSAHSKAVDRQIAVETADDIATKIASLEMELQKLRGIQAGDSRLNSSILKRSAADEVPAPGQSGMVQSSSAMIEE